MENSLKVCINGSIRMVPEGTTLKGLIGLFNLEEKAVVLEWNRQVVDRAVYSTTKVQESDSIEIVGLVGGG